MRSWDTFELILAAIAGGLLLILIVSFRSRAYVFCQYLRLMTGIRLTQGRSRRSFACAARKAFVSCFST